MPTIVVPTQAQLAQAHNNPTSLLAMYQAAQQPKPAVGSTGAVTAAGAVPGGGPSNLNTLSNPDWIKSMSEMINQINMDAQQKANAGRIPGAAGLESKSSEDIKAALSGQLPDDVVRQMAQRSAERGVFTGSPQGANSTADLMRSIGLNSLQLQGQGQDWLTAALGRNPAAPIANTQALVTTPAQAEALRLQQENMQLDYLARMAAINAANNRTRSGYGGGGGTSGGGGGGFNPATNWAIGGATSPLTANVPWNLPPGQTRAQGYNPYGDMIQPGMDMPYYDPSNDVVQPGMNYNPDTYNPGAYYANPTDYGNQTFNPSINTSGMSQDELDWLYNVGG